jgi:ankyrin repeat protein
MEKQYEKLLQFMQEHANDISPTIMADLIKTNKLDVTCRTDKGVTLLMHAIIKFNLDIVKLFCKLKFMLTNQDIEGKTALMYSIIYDNQKAYECLINEPSVDYMNLDKSGWSCACYALISPNIFYLNDLDTTLSTIKINKVVENDIIRHVLTDLNLKQRLSTLIKYKLIGKPYNKINDKFISSYILSDAAFRSVWLDYVCCFIWRFSGSKKLTAEQFAPVAKYMVLASYRLEDLWDFSILREVIIDGMPILSFILEKYSQPTNKILDKILCIIDINFGGEKGITPLMAALSNQRVSSKFLTSIFDKRPDLTPRPGFSPLYTAITKSTSENALIAMQNCPQEINSLYESNMTILMLAILNEKSHIVHYICGKHSGFILENAKDLNGENAVFYAARLGNIKIWKNIINSKLLTAPFDSVNIRGESIFVNAILTINPSDTNIESKKQIIETLLYETKFVKDEHSVAVYNYIAQNFKDKRVLRKTKHLLYSKLILLILTKSAFVGGRDMVKLIWDNIELA